MYRIPFMTRLVRWILRLVFRGAFHLLSRVKLTGFENIPRQGAYIVAVNHISLFEPPLVLSFWPVALEGIAAAEIWERRGQATLVRLYRPLQVHRGEYDRELVEVAIAALQAGRPLVIFPEGGRTHVPGLRLALPGVAYLIDKARVPVVPVGIVGTTEDFLKRALRGERSLLEMRVGPPFELPPLAGKGKERRLSRQRNADLVMVQIAALLPPEYQGVYAEAPYQGISA
jgi:1-acyl-sn-glycerol-3-phosphate acyltransferase